ncbi:hypothetical protein BB559_006955 [Furculomyces boomerangus]|uniref:Uncharacterized protein n=1 Tax=Furculomyces boomerangus TaxID=61424 RepID=A0A2T9XZN8_9FUNG|nr:hypothetical protein BB559_006955 [Furculomyces boomerangus]
MFSRVSGAETVLDTDRQPVRDINGNILKTNSFFSIKAGKYELYTVKLKNINEGSKCHFVPFNSLPTGNRYKIVCAGNKSEYGINCGGGESKSSCETAVIQSSSSFNIQRDNGGYYLVTIRWEGLGSSVVPVTKYVGFDDIRYGQSLMYSNSMRDIKHRTIYFKKI